MPSMKSRSPNPVQPPELAPLLKLIPTSVTRLLLVGCGDGTLGAALMEARKGLQVTGLAPAESAPAESGPAESGDETDAGSIPAVHSWSPDWGAGLPPHLDRSFDAIVVLGLFAAQRDPAAILGLLLPALRDGGCVVVGAPSLHSQQALHEVLSPEGSADTSVLRAASRGVEVDGTLARVALAVSASEEVHIPLDPAVEPVLAAVTGAGVDEAGLRQHLQVAGILWRAEVVKEAPQAEDEAYGRLRSTMAEAVASARRAGVAVGGMTRGGDASGDAARELSPAPQVSIVIPVYNQAQFTEACLYAIAGNTGEPGGGVPEYEVIVVDNGSDDWTTYLLHAMEGDIRVVSNDRNLGFARACNQGAAEARGEYVLFLNNDTVPHEGWLQPLVELADSAADIGVVGAKLLYPDTGKIQHAGLAMVQGVPEHVHRGLEPDDPRVDAVRDLDMVTGACLMIRRTLFVQLGGFDTQYLNGVEDVDLCLRSRDAGYRVVYCPASVIDHHEAVSDGRFDNVRDNVHRFLDTWGERFDADGVLIPASPPRVRGEERVSHVPGPEPPRPPKVTSIAAPDASQDTDGTGAGAAGERAPRSYRGNWEGSFFLHSSLAYVNRELTLALLESGRCDLGLVPFESDQFGPEEDPARFGALAQRMAVPLGDPDFHLRHRWPPDLTRPAAGHFVLMQPWEFGRIPRSWLEPIDQNVDQVWAYTEYVRTCYIDSGVDADRVAVVPLGIDPERFRPGLAPLDLATDKAFRLLFVGGTLYRKGIDLLLDAYRQAFTAADDVCLVVKDMGASTFYKGQTAGERIRKLQADPDCGEILYLTEDLPGEDIPRLYTAADALVHPYRGEGFGLPVAEAMACGLPVVISAGGACDDFCPPELAYMVPAGRQAVRFQEETAGQAWQLAPDLQALTGHLRHVFDHREEAVERGRRASEHIRTRFTWTNAASKALDALDALESAPRQRATAAAPTALAPPQPRGAAVVVLDAGETADLSGFSSVFGEFDRYDVTPGPEHALGAQLEAIRENSGGREVLAVLRSDVDASEVDVQALARHLAAHDDVGMVWPRPGGDATAEPTGGPYPDSACVLMRTAALARSGGFDASFQTAAVLANSARCLRRVGIRVEMSPDVTFTEVERSPTILRFGGDALEPDVEELELAAVRAVEEGDLHRESGQAEEAIDAYRRALEAKSDFVEAILVLADVLTEAARAPEAVEVIERLPELDQQSSFAHNYAGIVCHRAGQIDAARGHFVRAIELQPDLIEARVNLGVLEWDGGQADAAVSQFRRASDLDPGNRDLVANLSLVYQKLGQLDDAAEVLGDYLTSHPQDVDVQVQLAQLLDGKGDGEGARRAAQAALDQDPDNAAARAVLNGAGRAGEESGGPEETP